MYIKNCRQSRCRHHHRAIMGREEKSIRMVECLKKKKKEVIKFSSVYLQRLVAVASAMVVVKMMMMVPHKYTH